MATELDIPQCYTLLNLYDDWSNIKLSASIVYGCLFVLGFFCTNRDFFTHLHNGDVIITGEGR